MLEDAGQQIVQFFGYGGVAAVFIVLILLLVWLLVDMVWKNEGMSSGVGMMDGIYTSGMKGRWQTWRTDPIGNLSDLQSNPQGALKVSARDTMVGARPGYYFAEPQIVTRRAYQEGKWGPEQDRSTENFNQAWFGKPAFAKDRLSQTVEAASLHGR
tara:strand:- start:491 stop:958 length:468 start_codon:yes stop_codon:yes gene_type:complete